MFSRPVREYANRQRVAEQIKAAGLDTENEQDPKFD